MTDPQPQQQQAMQQAPSSSTSRQIVGSEGLGSTVAAVAQQVSALEKSTGGEISALRTEANLHIEALKIDSRRMEQFVLAEVARVEQRMEAIRESHKDDHGYIKEALDEAAVTIKERMEEMNQFRAQIDSERVTYVRVDMLGEMISTVNVRMDGLETMIRDALEKERSAGEMRFKPLEKTQISISTLIGAALFMVTVIGFVFAIVAYFVSK